MKTNWYKMTQGNGGEICASVWSRLVWGCGEKWWKKKLSKTNLFGLFPIQWFEMLIFNHGQFFKYHISPPASTEAQACYRTRWWRWWSLLICIWYWWEYGINNRTVSRRLMVWPWRKTLTGNAGLFKGKLRNKTLTTSQHILQDSPIGTLPIHVEASNC